MTGLVLKLAPGERVLINGAVIENGDRRSRLNIVTPNTHILRLRDAISADEATTPLRRMIYVAQLVLSGDISPEKAMPEMMQGIERLRLSLTDPRSHETLGLAAREIANRQFYRAMRALRLLLPAEDQMTDLPRQ